MILFHVSLQVQKLMDEHNDDLTGSEIVIGDTLEDALELGDRHEKFVTRCKEVRNSTSSLCTISCLCGQCVIILHLDLFSYLCSISIQANGETPCRDQGRRTAVVQTYCT